MSEQKELEEAVDKFAAEMKRRLDSKRKQGWRGWRTPYGVNMPDRLLRNASRGVFMEDKTSLIDTANLAMFLWLGGK